MRCGRVWDASHDGIAPAFNIFRINGLGKLMATELRIPKLGMGMTEGRLVEWLVVDGSVVSEGEIIYSLENDKSVNEVEAPESGVLYISAAANETYEVGALIGRIE